MKRTPLNRDPEKVREWLRRPRKQLQTRKPLRSGGRLRPLGRRRLRDRKRQLVDGPLCDRARAAAWCIGCLRRRTTRACHVRQGAPRRDWISCFCEDGYLWRDERMIRHERCSGTGFVGNVVPLCDGCHDRADGRVPGHGGRTQFESDTGLSLKLEAVRFADESGLSPPEPLAYDP